MVGEAEHSKMNCYLCGTPSLVELSTQLRNGPGAVLYCKACRIGILQATPSDIKKYYDQQYRKLHGPQYNHPSSYSEIFESYVNYQTQRIELLRPWLKPSTRLLEVGCSTGHFLYNVRGLVDEVVGVDYDSGAAEFASTVGQCTTFGCGLDEIDLPPASFDVVCAIQTMEHVEDPIDFVTMMGRYVKPPGIIHVEVPSLNDPLLTVYNNLNYRNFYFHEAHLFYFTPRSLMTVMNRAGFEGEVYFMQDYNFLNHLNWILLGKPQATCHDGLGSSKLPITDDVGAELQRELNTLMETVDKQYKAILAKYGVTDNIAFLGKLSRT
ncbi:class I SAM-dependent methyltransferase [Acidobacteria bacterium AH-259-A15]|nr:class I SAM-dependent methyltransferase [Acidobacteria bacterium AH-259-A15]